MPGGLCSDEQFATRTCPAPSLAGSARVITPVLPFQLSGPVYVVQEIGSVLPKLYVVLQGRGLEVVLRARNAFLKAVRTINTFDGLPDVPQAYFELKIRGGAGGILNNFYNACGVGSQKTHRKYDYTFTGQNGKQVKKVAYLEQEGCSNTGDQSVSASISTKTIKVNKKGIGKLRVSCTGGRSCKGNVTVSGKGVKASEQALDRLAQVQDDQAEVLEEGSQEDPREEAHQGPRQREDRQQEAQEAGKDRARQGQVAPLAGAGAQRISCLSRSSSITRSALCSGVSLSVWSTRSASSGSS